MGIVNVTPDSFSDGGLYATTEAAVAHGRELLALGADLLDIGGESTRPGATRPLVAEELDRVVPVVADSDAAYVAMHWRAHADRMRDFTDYSPDGVVETVRRELGERLDAAVAAGIPRERIVLDPGLGFAKEARHNWELLTCLDRLRDLGCPLLVGASRKSFLGRLLAEGGAPRPVDDREHAHAALVALLADRSVDVLRVHDVRATLDALAVARAMGVRREGATSPPTDQEESR